MDIQEFRKRGITQELFDQASHKLCVANLIKMTLKLWENIVQNFSNLQPDQLNVCWHLYTPPLISLNGREGEGGKEGGKEGGGIYWTIMDILWEVNILENQPFL